MSGFSFKKKYGPWALLAGAAEGLGEAYTHALAGRGVNIVMVDWQEERLNSLASKVEEKFGIQTRRVPVDLSQQYAAKEIMRVIRDVDCRLLIYNAAYSRVKLFIAYNEEELGKYIETNTHTPVKLVHAFVQQLKQKNHRGGILLMSSLAGLIGMQLVAPYAATKAFTWNLVESLHHELKVYRIDVMACIAGATATPAYLGTKPHYGLFKPSVMKPGKVAETTLDKLGRRTLFIPGFMNRFSYFILTRLLPRKAASAIANNTMRKMYGNSPAPD
jgi:short-subunit dehydrogenase